MKETICNENHRSAGRREIHSCQKLYLVRQNTALPYTDIKDILIHG